MRRNNINTNLAIAALAFGSLSMVACEDPNEKQAENEFNEYREYVETESDAFGNADEWEWEEYESNWQEYESNYQEHATGVEENMDYLSDENRREYERMQSEYEDRKRRYEERASEEKNNNSIDENSISGRMYAVVNISDYNNVDFSNVTAQNLRSTYKNFVDYIEKNKENMTAQDWRNAEIIWEQLNLRKNEVEDSVPTEDNVAIGTLKVEYGALKSSYGLAERIGDTTGNQKDLGDRTDKMEERNQNPKN